MGPPMALPGANHYYTMTVRRSGLLFRTTPASPLKGNATAGVIREFDGFEELGAGWSSLEYAHQPNKRRAAWRNSAR